MLRPVYSPSTMPAPPAPDPLLLFIQQAQLTLAYKKRGARDLEKPYSVCPRAGRRSH
jgi:hypothetical protein